MKQPSLSVFKVTMPAVLGVKRLSNTKHKKGGYPEGRGPRSLIGNIGLGTQGFFFDYLQATNTGKPIARHLGHLGHFLRLLRY